MSKEETVGDLHLRLSREAKELHSEVKPVLDLWVVGESSPDPETWSQFSEWSLVIAQNAQQARLLAGESAYTPCCRIPLDRPLHLCSQLEPKMGDDL